MKYKAVRVHVAHTNVNVVLLNYYCLRPSGSGSYRPITSLVWRLRGDRLYARAGLKSTIADVCEKKRCKLQ